MAGDRDNSEGRGFKPKVNFGSKRPGAKGFVFSPEGAFLHEDGELHTLADAVDIFWHAIAENPAGWAGSRKGYDWLVEHAAQADREDVRRTLNWLEAALARRDRNAAIAAATYLEAMPSALLAADYGRLVTIFNSRIVGMVWTLTPHFDVTPLPPKVPRWGKEAGFGLVRAVPALYEKLAMFGPEMEEIVTGLVEEALRYRLSLPENLSSLAKPFEPKG